MFYSHVNYSVTKIREVLKINITRFYSHVNYSVTKIAVSQLFVSVCFTVT